MRDRRVRLWDSRPTAWKLTADAAEDARTVEELKSWLAVQFVGSDKVVIKDPRIAWFLPLWQRSASELEIETSFALVSREPPEVVASARKWYGTKQSDASRAAAWLNVMLHSEAATRGAPRSVTRYDKLLADWPGEIARIGEPLGLPSLSAVERSAYPQIEAFVDPTLRRSAASWDKLKIPGELRALADQAWEQLSRLTEPGGDDEAARTALDTTRAAYVELYSQAEALTYSSLTAAAPRRRRFGRDRRKRLGRAKGAMRRKASRVVPYRQRERLRLAAAAVPLGMGGLAGLPLRMALMVPPRYRERVPVPVVRAFMRFFRWLRD
jgi:hypothetical protein